MSGNLNNCTPGEQNKSVCRHCSFFFSSLFIPSLVSSLIWFGIRTHVCDGLIMYHASLLVCIRVRACVWLRACHAACRKLAQAIWLLEKASASMKAVVHLLCEPTVQKAFPRAWRGWGGGIITNTDWWLLMSGHEASWRFVATPQHEISKKVEDRTYFCFFWLPLNRIKTHTQTSAGFTWTQLTLQCLKSKHLHWNTHARTHNTHRPEAVFWHVISDYSKK